MNQDSKECKTSEKKFFGVVFCSAQKSLAPYLAGKSLAVVSVY